MRRLFLLLLLTATAGGAAALTAVPAFRDRLANAWDTATVAFSQAVNQWKRPNPGTSPPAVKRERPIPVETARAADATLTDDLRATGSLRSDESVVIAPEIAGRIATIAFDEGRPVKKGDVLFTLDDALAQAELADAAARYELAKANLARARTLSQSGSVTEKARDEAVSTFATAEAAVELARVRLAKHTVRAPFDGVVGLRNLSSGAYAAAGAPVVNIEKIDVLKADFKIPEVFLSRISNGQAVELLVDAHPGRAFTGTIYAMDPQIDVNGRALAVRALVPNPDGALRPGLFARILIKGRQERFAVTVPESAVFSRSAETFVYRVENGKAVETKVRLGVRLPGNVEITEGLTAGTTVVTAGQLKLRNGAAVEPVGAGTGAGGKQGS